MASETEVPELNSLFERLLRHRDLSLFLPFILGFTTIQRENTNANTDTSSDQNTPNPDQETREASSTTAPNERIILINPFTQGMVVIEGSASFESLLRDVASKDGQPPASKASIEALPSVEIGEAEDEDGECVICLEEWEKDAEKVVKEMPCKHRFHANCIEKWLKIHGSCPVCRYKMPVDEEEMGKKRDDGQSERERRSEREIWVTFSIGGNRRRSETANENSNDNSSSSDHEMEN